MGTFRVAFQGEEGAYSESAITAFYGRSVSRLPCRTFVDVFECLQKGEADAAVIPIENSIEGSVNQNFDLLLTYDLLICGEVVLKIDHCLISNPDVDLNMIKTVYSHPQALAQCSVFLRNFGRNILPSYDTAGSVKMIRDRGLRDAAAVASERAAKLYGMKVLAKNIADVPNNFTRFLVLSKADSPPTGRDKTSVVMSVRHVPGSLYEALGELASRGINLTKIESRPTKRTPWEYNMFIDFEGHREDKVCREALDGLRSRSLFLKVLGSYPASSGPVDLDDEAL